MRTIVIGLGVQGNKRQLFAGKDFQFSIDPLNAKATFKNLDEVDFQSFDSALLCIPDELKFDYVKIQSTVIFTKSLRLTLNVF